MKARGSNITECSSFWHAIPLPPADATIKTGHLRAVENQTTPYDALGQPRRLMFGAEFQSIPKRKQATTADLSHSVYASGVFLSLARFPWLRFALAATQATHSRQRAALPSTVGGQHAAPSLL